MLGSTYYLLCINGVPRVKWLTELKATAFDFGIMAGLGSFAIIFQMYGSILTNQLERRKPLWICIATLHRLVFLGALLAPVLFVNERLRIWWIIFVFLVHDSLTHTSVPLWLSWMADVVPQNTMNRHWASRQRFITAWNIAGMVAVALGFHFFEKSGHVMTGFTIFASVGVLFGVVDILMFWVVPEPPGIRSQHRTIYETLAEPLRDSSFRPFLWLMAYWNFSIFLSAPFFGLFMIDKLHMSVLTVQLLSIPNALGVVISSRYWGVLCDTYGFRRVLQVLSVGKAFAPLPYVIAPAIPHVAIPIIALITLVDGILNSGVALATQGVLLKATPRANRATYIAASNFLSVGIVAAIAPVIAGWLIDVLDPIVHSKTGAYEFTGYHVIFCVSILLRLGAIWFAARLHEERDVPMQDVLTQMASLDALRVTKLVTQLESARGEGERVAAVRELGNLENPMAVPELAQTLEDPNIRVRVAAAEALGSIATQEAAQPLGSALLDPGSEVQPVAARALGRIGGLNSLRPLLVHLHRPTNRKALVETVDSLGRIGDSAAIVPLICVFHEHEDEEVRHRIAQALSRISQAESPEEVLCTLEGGEPTKKSP